MSWGTVGLWGAVSAWAAGSAWTSDDTRVWGGGSNPPPAGDLVLSVENLEHALLDGDLSEDFQTGAGHTLANCIVFGSAAPTQNASAPFADRLVRWFVGPGAPNLNITLQRSGGDDDVTANVSLLEFDGTRVAVQQGGIFSAGTTISQVISALSAVANAFVVHSWQLAQDVDDGSIALLSAEVSDTTHLVFRRGQTGGNMLNSWYVADCADGGWGVQHVAVSAAGSATSGTGAISAVDLSKSTLWAWPWADTDADLSSSWAAVWDLPSTTSARLRRGLNDTPAGTLSAVAQVLTVGPTEAPTMQQAGFGELGAADTSISVTISAVDTGNATIHAGGNGAGEIDDIGADGPSRYTARMDLESSTSARARNALSGISGLNLVGQVVEWL